MTYATKRLSKWAAAMLAMALAVAFAPTSRAGDQPPGDAGVQPAASQPTASQPASAQPVASQPAASQPTRDQRLEELEKEVTVFQQEIASLKADSTPEMKTVA